MKRITALLTGVVILTISLFITTQTSEAAINTDYMEIKHAHRLEKIQKKLEIIKEKAGEEVKNKVAENMKIKEARIAAEKAAKEAAAKEAAAKEAAAKQAAAEQAAAEQAAAEQAAAEQASQQSDRGENADAISGASQYGSEKGQRNREYGQQLRDPNLSQDQRQQIIQEKKNYNKGHR